MKVRGTIAGTPLSAKLTVLCWGALTLLVPMAVSACTSGTTSSAPPVFSPTVTTGTAPTSGTTPASDTSTETGTPGVTTSPATTTPPATPEVTVTQTITVPPSTVPPAAPVTGGGGTAGFQDTLLLTLGAVAILAGTVAVGVAVGSQVHAPQPAQVAGDHRHDRDHGQRLGRDERDGQDQPQGERPSLRCPQARHPALIHRLSLRLAALPSLSAVRRGAAT